MDQKEPDMPVGIGHNNPPSAIAEKAPALKIAYSPQGAADALEVGKNKIYDWLNDGSLTAKNDGGRTLITGAALVAKVDSLPDYVPADA